MRPTPFSLAHRLIDLSVDPYPDKSVWPLLVGIESKAYIMEQFGVHASQHDEVAKYVRVKITRSDTSNRVRAFDFWAHRNKSVRERARSTNTSTSVLYRLYENARLPTIYYGPDRRVQPETSTGADLCDMWGLTKYVTPRAAATYFGVRTEALEEAHEKFGTSVYPVRNYVFLDMLPLLGFVGTDVLCFLYPETDRAHIIGMRHSVCVPNLVKQYDIARVTAQQWYACPEIEPELVAKHRRWPLRFAQLLFKNRHAFL